MDISHKEIISTWEGNSPRSTSYRWEGGRAWAEKKEETGVCPNMAMTLAGSQYLKGKWTWEDGMGIHQPPTGENWPLTVLSSISFVTHSARFCWETWFSSLQVLVFYQTEMRSMFHNEIFPNFEILGNYYLGSFSVIMAQWSFQRRLLSKMINKDFFLYWVYICTCLLKTDFQEFLQIEANEFPSLPCFCLRCHCHFLLLMWG